MPLAAFLQMTRLVRFDLSDVRVARIDASDGRAEVAVVVTATAALLPRPFEQEIVESWIQGPNGQWYKEDEPLLLPFDDPVGGTPARPPPGTR